jgi:hypothetical protein
MDGVGTVSRATRNFYFWGPIIAQVVFAAVIWILLGYFHKSASLAYLGLIFTCGPSAIAIVMLARHQWSSAWAVGALSAHSAILIVHFAGVHFIEGVNQGAVTIWDALYFSMVTWVTLGYGDFTPIPTLRMLAAIEAMYGYVFFGLIVALLSASFNRRTEQNG